MPTAPTLDCAPMLLVVDVGNTQTHFGTYRDGTLVEHWRFATVRDSTADELGAVLRNLLELRGIGLADLNAVVVSSTVPQLRPEWESMAARYLDHGMMVVGPGIKTGMGLRYENPREIGPDRLVNAVAAYDKVHGACVVVDFGTAVTYDPVSAEGEFRSGIIYGYAGQVDGILRRLRAELGEDLEAIATGGLAEHIVPFAEEIDETDDLLTLTGLRLLHERNA